MTDDSLLQEAIRLDASDPLCAFRDAFHLPANSRGEPHVYLCGHSLGLQPRGVEAMLAEEVRAWQKLGVDGHFAGERPWVSYHEHLTKPLAKLAGAQPVEVVAMNSLTVNLHLLMASFYRPTRERHKILIEHSAFPSDRYAVASQLRWHGFDPTTSLIEVAPREGEYLIRSDDLSALLEREGPSIALILLPGVNYLTGQVFDLAAITVEGRRQGCRVGFDLAHAIGNVPLTLHDSGADFSVWCGYKYLNGGPGAIGGAFVHERHARAATLPRLAGWWGHDKQSRFSMPHGFAPLQGAEGWQVSNPSIFAMAPLTAALAIFEQAGMQALRAKSEQLTAFLIRALQSRLGNRVRILTPTEPSARGSQLSLLLDVRADRAKNVHDRLTAAGVVCDWREPNVVRAAPVPLYNTYKDAWKLVEVLEETVT